MKNNYGEELPEVVSNTTYSICEERPHGWCCLDCAKRRRKSKRSIRKTERRSKPIHKGWKVLEDTRD